MIGIIKSTKSKFVSAIVPKIATGRPKTIQMLKILLPTRLPTRSSLSCFFAATIVVTISGRAVPKLMIVKEIMRSEMPIVVAISVAEFTTSSPPTMTPVKPSKVKSSDLPSLYFGFSTCFLVSLRWRRILII